MCYDCSAGHMRTIPHRELRNNSAKVLADVKNGAVIEVTNHGEVVAVLIPPQTSRLAVLEAAGLVMPASSTEPFSALQRVMTTESTADLIGDLRGER